MLFSHIVVSDSLGSHGLQHSRPPCPLPSPEVCPSYIGDTIQPSHLLPSSLPGIRDFSNEQLFASDDQTTGASASVLPMSIGFLKIDCFDLLAVQGTFRSLLQHRSSKASILQHSAFVKVQLSQQYMTTGKTTALTIRTFVGRVMSLLSTHCLGLS